MSNNTQARNLTGRRTPREMYDNFPGRVEVRFRHAKYDWIQMRIRAYGRRTEVRYLDDAFNVVGMESIVGRRQTISCRLSSFFCPFPGLLAWLAALTTGVQGCRFEWECEGPSGAMGWDFNRLWVEWSSFNSVKKITESLRLESDADRKQLVSAFYTAFRRFVSSPEYRPERYENLLAGEEMVIALEREYTEDELRGLLLDMDAQAVEEALQKLRPHGYTTVAGMEPGEPGAWKATVDALYAEREGAAPEHALRTVQTPYIVGPWDRWSTAKRRACLDDIFTWRSVGGGLGSPLRDLRSELVERWLRWDAPSRASSARGVSEDA